VWDIAKCALMRRVGRAELALVVVGFSDNEWRHRRYGQLLTDKHWETAEFQRAYRRDWRHWTGPAESGKEHRKGPYRLPIALTTRLLGRYEFGFRAQEWTLGVVQVEALPGEWVGLDDWAQPTGQVTEARPPRELSEARVSLSDDKHGLA